MGKSTLEAAVKLEREIHYTFSNRRLLEQALTHSSHANIAGVISNERMEYLGDAVLELVVSEHLYSQFPDANEGELTKQRAKIVSEPSLVSAAMELDIGVYLMLGKGEEITAGREKPSILANTFEAVIGAVYLDGGLKHARKFIMKNLIAHMPNIDKREENRDFKTELQHALHSSYGCDAVYNTRGVSGPAHNRIFYSKVYREGALIGRGEGKSKKEAEQKAAKQALENGLKAVK
ncbi:MAG: ribonuclease III [Bacillota bacterium]|nr:ribonuclease III [Bacillota bacterium]